jgi:hypothetical protein
MRNKNKRWRLFYQFFKELKTPNTIYKKRQPIKLSFFMLNKLIN